MTRIKIARENNPHATTTIVYPTPSQKNGVPADFSGKSVSGDGEPFWDILRDGVTQSVLGTFASCPRKADYRVRQGLTSFGMTGALAFGDLFHRGLDGVYGAIKGSQGTPSLDLWIRNVEALVEDTMELICDEEKSRFRTGVRTIADVTATSELELNAGMAQVMLKAYFKRWNTDFSDLTWVDLEKVFEAKYTMFIPPSHVLGEINIPVRGKFDGVFLDHHNKHWLFETKTKSVIDDPSLADKLNFDLQVMLYLWAMRQVYNATPQGVVYNLVRRPALRQKQREPLPEFLERIAQDVIARPETYFVRYTATILPEELDEWAATDLAQLMQQIWEWANGKGNYRNSGSCYMWNRPCEFMRVCAHGDSSHLTQRKVVFPELQEVEAS